MPDDTKPTISTRKAKRLDGIVHIRVARDDQDQQLGYLAKPFLLMGLPFKRIKEATYRRTSGKETLTITTSSDDLGLPFGEDILVLIWVSTLAVLQKKDGRVPRVIEFQRAADMLRTFGLPLDGRTYRRMHERFLRVFHATFTYGSSDPDHRSKLYRVHFFDAVDLWFTRDLETAVLPGDDFVNRIRLSEAFAHDLEQNHPPIDLEAVKMWADSPAQLFFYLWLTYRCFTARTTTRVPLMGNGSLQEQCGLQGYEDPVRGRLNLRRNVRKWLSGVKLAWPACPVKLIVTQAGDFLTITARGSKAINERANPG